MTMEAFLAHQVVLAHQVEDLAHQVIALNLKEVKQRQQQPERKPQAVETSQKASALEDMPEYWITNRYGRRDVNPEFIRVRDALERAESRIRAANDPERYRAAIIARERGRMAG